ncbi:MAG: substrate-binding domain-containing protein [Fimbriimonadales bacterium]
MFKKMGIWTLASVAVAVTAACGGPTEEKGSGGTTKKDSAYTIAVIPKGMTHEFWKSVHAGAEDAAKELGVNVIWQGPQQENDREGQIKVVEDFVSKGVSGIVLAPLDDTALRTPVDQAQKSGIPVLIIDSDLKDVETVSFVATDNMKGGEMAGEHLGRVLGGKGKVVMLRYQEGSASTTFREEGFMNAMKKFPNIQVVSSNQFAGPTGETAQKASENLLAPYKGADGMLSIQGIYCPNESSTFGMLRTLQDNGWAGKIRFVGFDASEKLVTALKDAQIDGLILQNPFNMGYLGVKMMVSKLKGETVDKRIDTGAVLVTKDNMSQPEVAKLLAPPKE